MKNGYSYACVVLQNCEVDLLMLIVQKQISVPFFFIKGYKSLIYF